MAFGQPNYPYFNNPGYQSAVYPQMVQSYTQQRQDFMQQSQSADVLFARIVSCREEAVASQVIADGKPHLFYCPTEQCVFVKRIDPVTNVASFDACPFPSRIQAVQTVQETPVAPQTQFATKEDLEALRADFEAMRSSMQPAKTTRKAVMINEE